MSLRLPFAVTTRVHQVTDVLSSGKLTKAVGLPSGQEETRSSLAVLLTCCWAGLHQPRVLLPAGSLLLLDLELPGALGSGQVPRCPLMWSWPGSCDGARHCSRQHALVPSSTAGFLERACLKPKPNSEEAKRESVCSLSGVVLVLPSLSLGALASLLLLFRKGEAVCCGTLCGVTARGE